MNLADLVAQPTRRDRWGRYLVVPPDGGKPSGYTRATTIAKTLDDSGGLLGWGKRMVAIGLGRRPDLVGLIAATDSNDKRALDELCERAAEAGGSTVRRDQGIALHAALEQSWDDAEKAPGMFLEDVRAVHRALAAAGLRPVPQMAERIVVNDIYQVAGTFDLVLTDGTNNYVADVKTGSSLLGALAFSIQLALYATANNLYVQGAAKDGSEDVREPMPDLDKGAGVILHVQPNSAVCDLHWIDLETGWEALQLAMDVRDIRKAKVLRLIDHTPHGQAIVHTTPAEAVEIVKEAFPDATEEPLVNDAWRDWMRTRIAAVIEAGGADRLRTFWPANTATLKSGKPITIAEGLDLEALLDATEAYFELPFSDLKPGTVIEPPIAEGDDVAPQVVRDLAKLVKGLDEAERAWVDGVQKACTAAKASIRMTGNGGRPTERRMLILSALIELAPYAVGSPDVVGALLDQFSERPGSSIGAQVGKLRRGQTVELRKEIRKIQDGHVLVLFDDTGKPIFERQAA